MDIYSSSVIDNIGDLLLWMLTRWVGYR